MANKQADIFVSCVFVADQYSNTVAAKVRALSKILKKLYSNYEVIIVDNGVTNKERRQLQDLLPVIACLRIIQLSKAYDTDTAIFAGIDSAIGDFVCILYAVDPVEMVPEFITKATKADIVFGVATNLRRRSLWQELGARLFYWYNRKYLAINIPRGSTYFICMNRPVVNVLTSGGRYLRHIHG